MHHARLHLAEEDIINMLGWKLPPLVLPSFIVSERTQAEQTRISLPSPHTHAATVGLAVLTQVQLTRYLLMQDVK